MGSYICVEKQEKYLCGYSLSRAMEVILNLLQTYGSKPSADEIKNRGETCPICQDDYQDPVMLSCKVRPF